MLLGLLESTEALFVFYCLMLQNIWWLQVATSQYPKLFDVPCVAHSLHNCTIKVKPYFEDVNQPIA